MLRITTKKTHTHTIRLRLIIDMHKPTMCACVSRSPSICRALERQALRLVTIEALRCSARSTTTTLSMLMLTTKTTMATMTLDWSMTTMCLWIIPTIVSMLASSSTTTMTMKMKMTMKALLDEQHDSIAPENTLHATQISQKKND